MKLVFGWTGLFTSAALIIFFISDVVQFTAFLHAHNLQWSWAIIQNNPVMPGRWFMWLFIAAVLIGNSIYSVRAKSAT